MRFADVAPLRVYGVGVHYTGQGLDIAAPTQADVLSTLSFAETTYPVGEVEMTGYLAHDFADDMRADIDDGCGDGFNSLLDDLRDMRGGSTDVYYGVLPGGIDSGSVGGCGGGGVGAGFINGGATAAQEIGHAFGRDHAPCDDEARCGNPAHQDGSYPSYSPFPSDSIGEFGYDPRSHDVKPPGSFFDFMGYSGPDWVSPFTYEGLMTRFPSTSGIGDTASALRLHRQAFEAPTSRLFAGRAEWIRREMPTLFLWLNIDRDRAVERLPSFHFETTTRTRGQLGTPFTAEILDADGQIMSCQRLHSECRHCADDCWPKRVREQIPFPDGATRLVVREGDDIVQDERIGDPPRLDVRGEYDKRSDRVHLEWACGPTGGKPGSRAATKTKDNDENDCWYLVQYLDDRGVWRGLRPRTMETTLWVSPQLAARKGSLVLRVLATGGIATAIETVEVEVPTPAEPPRVTVASLEPTGSPESGLRSSLSVVILDELGRTVSDPDIVWYDDKRVEVGRGRTLDLSGLTEGQHVIYPAVLGTADVGTHSGILVDRSPEGSIAIHSGLTPEQESARDTHPPWRPRRALREGGEVMQIRTGSITFGQFKGSGPRASFADVTFPNALTQATAILTGMQARFSPNDGDHHLGDLDVRLNSSTSGSTVRVTATFGLRDWSGTWDDNYDGQVFFAVVAE